MNHHDDGSYDIIFYRNDWVVCTYEESESERIEWTKTVKSWVVARKGRHKMAPKRMDILWTINYLMTKFSTLSRFSTNPNLLNIGLYQNRYYKMVLVQAPNNESVICVSKQWASYMHIITMSQLRAYPNSGSSIYIPQQWASYMHIVPNGESAHSWPPTPNH